MSADPMTRDALIREVESNPAWYHTMELGQGVVTPGWFDLRPIIDQLPWPDVRGKRCLDVGTYDGHLAFELERRGAAEVVATDIADHKDWDWPVALREEGPPRVADAFGQKGHGFEIAAAALGSAVNRKFINVYDLSPEHVGTFEVVVCGSLLLHLRDPIRALEAIRSICRGVFMSCEEIALGYSVLHRHAAISTLDGVSDQTQWHVPNLTAHRRMLMAGGFRIERTIRPYCVPFGVAHPPQSRKLKPILTNLFRRIVAGRMGVPHSAVVARPV